MRIAYLRKQEKNHIRKISLDMAYLVTHNLIRLPIDYFEDGLFLPYKDNDNKLDSYFLTKDKIKKEDKDFYYFDFPFEHKQVEDAAF
jgi:hypothetical protein